MTLSPDAHLALLKAFSVLFAVVMSVLAIVRLLVVCRCGHQVRFHRVDDIGQSCDKCVSYCQVGP